jgi:Na+:H+ antiporter, NhaA family
MPTAPHEYLSETFRRFFGSEKAGGIMLIACTAISLLLANSPVGDGYRDSWHAEIAGMSVEHWINDGFMAVFFLFIGLELERELYNGELSNPRKALLPILAALGGVIAPALIHLSLNAGTQTQGGIGIPMATDIAFALGILSLLGNRVPWSLKVFLAALAVMDDLAAIVVIAIFYTEKLSLIWLGAALGVLTVLVVLNRMRVMMLFPYLLGGVLMWFLMLKSGVHATIAGVLLAFAIPFSARRDDQASPSHRLEHFLHKPVAFLILPLFALANTGILIGADWRAELATNNSVGIIAGLVLGKPIGILVLSSIAVALGLCRLPDDVRWHQIVGAGFLGGIGFTMSIFIANLAFASQVSLINSSKMAILLASFGSALLGFLWLLAASRRAPGATSS